MIILTGSTLKSLQLADRQSEVGFLFYFEIWVRRNLILFADEKCWICVGLTGTEVKE